MAPRDLVHINIYLTPWQVAGLDDLVARERRRSRAEVVREAVQEYLDRRFGRQPRRRVSAQSKAGG